MQDDLEVAIKDLGQTLVILPDLKKRKRRKRQLSGIGGFKAPWAGGGAILLEEEGADTQRRSSSQTGESPGAAGSEPQGGDFEGEFQGASSQRRSSETEELGGGAQVGGQEQQF